MGLRTQLREYLNKSRETRFFAKYKYAFHQKNGLEIGGPSGLFSTGILPIYQWANSIDGCNFSDKTLWEGDIDTSGYAYYPGKTGKQYIIDGSDLSRIKSNQYDFLLSCHNLEHIANPLKAIKEWVRMLKPGGLIMLVLPEKTFTFDHKRSFTPFEHLLADFENATGEDDLTHLTEILELHDLSRDGLAGDNFDSFKKRGENNFINRALHHHVFSQDVLQSALAYFNVKTLDQYFTKPYHQIILGRK